MMLHIFSVYGTRPYGLLGPIRLIFLYYLILCNNNVVHCDPPDEPIKCSSENSNCTISNSYGAFPDRSTCHASNIVYPENEEQLISYVRDATKMKRNIKVATRYGHSATKLVCPDGEDGLIISTKNLSKIININVTGETMTVESGMLLMQLIDEAAKVNLALPNSPYWSGLTIGGMLGTGAHGSSLWGLGSAVHDYVVSLKMVSPGEEDDDYVKVRTLSVGDEDLDAAKVSLGVLGVISQVTFKLEPLFKRNITFITRDDQDLEIEAPKFGVQHEFADIVWLPNQRKATYRIDNRVPTSTPGNGVYDVMGFRSVPRFLLESSRTAEDIQESLGCGRLRCITATTSTTLLIKSGFGLSNNGILFTGYPVIGYQNKLQASASCLNKNNIVDGYCGWDPRINGHFFTSNGFTLPLNKVTSFIQDLKKLVNMDPSSFCGIEFHLGILMRYVKVSSAYLGKDEDGVDFDIAYYRPKEELGPRLNEDIMEEIEQLAIFKYGGVPHWGKNRNVAFEGVISKYKDGEKFLRVKERYDPLGLFSSEWTDQVLGLKEGIIINKTGCALEGLCRCNTDKDCGTGYTCESGKVYDEAKVCKKKRSNLIFDNCLIG